MAYIRCAGDSGGSIQKKTATGAVATFNTGLPAPLIDVTSAIGYRSNGYTSATVINSKTTPVIDETPYHTRLAPSNIGNMALEKLVGVSVCFNQLIGNNLRASQTQGDVAYTNNGDGSFTLNGTATADDYWVCTPYPNNNLTVGHKYLLWEANNASIANQYGIGWRTAPTVILVNPTIINCSDASDAFVYIYKNGAVINNVTFRPQLIDLTAMFGSEVADYLYTLENS